MYTVRSRKSTQHTYRAHGTQQRKQIAFKHCTEHMQHTAHCRKCTGCTHIHRAYTESTQPTVRSAMQKTQHTYSP